MSEAMFERILDELKVIKAQQQEMRAEQQEMRVQQQEMRAEQQEMRAEQQEMRAEQQEMRAEQQEMRAEQQEFKQALFETLETVKRIETAQQAFEQKTNKRIDVLESGMDLLNRRQFKLEVELEMLKSR
ncbi:fibronectin type 3 domain-containing protein [Paenibacillus forsythiae]|uniref:Fibronectin type 3 domain-containing protein n=1 Tax=Paenibacillus forsythiae TaxID=365616 RepID=A0ABU3HE72_9BACL|nr:hypothetical protein [Paenibacillus forsythiae]MDT3429115.1 fibronectin type 3 domain-containing protein [Paenibacillus forsythiae]